MRTLTSVALAGSIAASALAATATSATAGGGWYGHHGPPPVYNHYYYYGPDAGAVAAGAIIGLAFGALTAQAFAPTPYYYAYPPPAPLYSGYNPHAAWCSAQFDSYNPTTNTWVDFYGVVHICNGPY